MDGSCILGISLYMLIKILQTTNFVFFFQDTGLFIITLHPTILSLCCKKCLSLYSGASHLFCTTFQLVSSFIKHKVLIIEDFIRKGLSE